MTKKLKIKPESKKYLKLVDKAWGQEKWIVNKDYGGKMLVLKKGFRCSYHCHKAKDETFYINKGKILLELGQENLKSAKKVILEEGESQSIKPGLYHRFTGLIDSEIIEFSTTYDDLDSFRQTASGRARPPSVFEKIIDNFKNAKVLVIGDAVLDQYLDSQPQKISQEAPILVCRAGEIKNIIGAAANVAVGLKDLNVKADLIAVIGDDQEGKILKEMLKKSGISPAGIFIDKKRKTTKKIRIVAKNKQLLRLDYEDCQDINEELENKIFKFFRQAAPNYDVVVLADYAKGILTKNLTKKIISFCQKLRIKTVVDPKPSHAGYYQGATVITPNLTEGLEITKTLDETKLKEIGRELQEKFKAAVVLTLGSEGMMVFDQNKVFKIKASSQAVFDVSGAGDTVVTLIAAALAAGAKFRAASELANIAAGIQISKFGNATVSSQELKDYFCYHLLP